MFNYRIVLPTTTELLLSPTPTSVTNYTPNLEDLPKELLKRLRAVRKKAESLPLNKLNQRVPLLTSALAGLVFHFVTKEGLREEPAGCHSWTDLLYEAASILGFTPLGDGWFSIVFSNDLMPERAIKVGLKKEDAGAAYLAYCRSHEGATGLPKVHSMKRFEACYVAELDLLKAFPCFSVECTPEQNAQYDIISKRVCDEPEKTPFRHLYPELADTCESVREFFEDIASFDIHTGNVMIDKRGDLVLTDPVSYSVC